MEGKHSFTIVYKCINSVTKQFDLFLNFFYTEKQFIIIFINKDFFQ